MLAAFFPKTVSSQSQMSQRGGIAFPVPEHGAKTSLWTFLKSLPTFFSELIFASGTPSVFFPHFRILAIVRPVDDIPTFCQGESLFYQQQTLGDVSCKASQATSSWVSPCWQQIGSVPVKIRCLDHDQPIVGRSMAHFVMSFNHHKFGGKDVMFFFLLKDLQQFHF